MCGCVIKIARKFVWLGLLVGLSWATACQWNVGTLDVRLVYEASAVDPLGPGSGITDIRIQVEGESLGVRRTEFSKENHTGRLPDVPVGERVRVVVEGLNSIGQALYRGVSTEIEIQAGNNQVFLFFSKIGDFSAPPAVSSAIAPEWADRYRTTLRPGLGRAFHTASVLSDGNILLTGGTQHADTVDHLLHLSEDQVLRSTELFDPTAGAFFRDSVYCLDGDGDGYGPSPDCLGSDCDDDNPSLHTGCGAVCEDVDLDGYGIGDDCLGGDCDDGDASCAVGACCGECPGESESLCMSRGRAHHAALELAGKDAWLLLGGEPAQTGPEGEFYAVLTRVITLAPSNNVPRTRMAAGVIGAGELVLAGGISAAGEILSGVESSGPGAEFSQAIDTLSVARSGATSVVYPGGMMVIGGWETFPGWPQEPQDFPDRRASTAIDLITVSGGVVTVTPLSVQLNQARAEAAAVVFPGTDGKTRVLVCGGLIDASTATNTCETIFPSAQLEEDKVVAWDPDQSLPQPRWKLTGTLLPDGNVLFAGGFPKAPGASASNLAVILNPITQSSGDPFAMANKRAGHTATLMPNGMVLLAGGIAQPRSLTEHGLPAHGYEIYNP